MNQHTRSTYLLLHFCVLIWGFTAILGKLISLKSLSLVWWRVALCAVVLYFLVRFASKVRADWSSAGRLMGIGAIMGLHWVCFYESIKLANASIGAAAVATISFFCAFIEPVLLKRKLLWYEVFLSALVIPGVLLLSGGLDVGMRMGLYVGILSSFLAAIFTTLNKREIDLHNPTPLNITFFNVVGALLVTSVALLWTRTPFQVWWPQSTDWWWLLVLSIGCTIVPQYLVMKVMKHLSAFSVNLATNLEPVYSIILAIILFREDRELNLQFYLGVGLILASVFSYPYLKGAR